MNGSKEKSLQRFARAGLISKGIVYCLMGILSTLAAFGLSGKNGDKSEAFKLVYHQPFGKFLLFIIAAGLLGFVTLRIFQTFFDTEKKGKNMKGVFTRIGFAISALIYLGMSIYAIRLALDKPDGGSDTQQFFVAKMMEYSYGVVVVVVAALIIIGNGIYQIHKGVTARFMKKVKLHHSGFGDTFKKVGMMGYVSRGVVMGVVGYFFLRAALDANPHKAQGTGGAFDFIQNNFGNILMAIIALGLVAYGVFMFVRARHEYFHFNTN